MGRKTRHAPFNSPIIWQVAMMVTVMMLVRQTFVSAGNTRGEDEPHKQQEQSVAQDRHSDKRDECRGSCRPDELRVSDGACSKQANIQGRNKQNPSNSLNRKSWEPGCHGHEEPVVRRVDPANDDVDQATACDVRSNSAQDTVTTCCFRDCIGSAAQGHQRNLETYYNHSFAVWRCVKGNKPEQPPCGRHSRDFACIKEAYRSS